MSEKPELYWSPLLLPLRPADMGDLTPEQLLQTFDFQQERLKHGIW